MMRSLGILILLFWGTVRAQEQKSLVIRDQDSGDPIPYATLLIQSSSAGGQGDEQGRLIWTWPLMPGDTLIVSALGYERKRFGISGDWLPESIFLKKQSQYLGEVVIYRGEPPGLRFMRKVWAHKPEYDPKRWKNRRYRAYSKVQLDMMNLSRAQFESLPVPFIRSLGFVYDNQVEDSMGRRRLPFFLTEALSLHFVRRQPFRQKEIIQASQMRGIDNASIRQFLGSHYLTIDPYETYINVINKRFLSPLSPLAEHFYDFEIIDTLWESPHRPILLGFRPRYPDQKLLEGEMQIVDSFYRLHFFRARVPAGADLNWVSEGEFEMTYDWVEDSLWMPVGERWAGQVEISSQVRLPAIYCTKTHIYDQYRVEDPGIEDSLNLDLPGGELVLVEGNDRRDSLYWEIHRPVPLNLQEASIYRLYDTLESLRPFQRLRDLAKILATGVWKTGPVEWGPYWNLYSRNPLEGHRFRGTIGTTPAFSSQWFLQAYLAYGTLDKSFKYQASALYILRKNPRISFWGAHRDDLDSRVNFYDRPGFDNLFHLAVRRPSIPWKLTRVRQTEFEYLHTYTGGISHKLMLQARRIQPLPPLPGSSLLRDEAGNPQTDVSVWELGIQLRYALEERFLEGHYYRFSLGSKHPIFTLDLGMGYQEGWKGRPYHRIRFSASDQIPVAPLGKISLNLFGGKYFGRLPYLLLENHPGNESYFYRRNSMNLFPHYYFLSDQYLGVYLEHNLEWSLFQYIPLLSKAKIRQFWNIKPMIGSLSPGNQQENLGKGYAFQTLNSGPYVEFGTGLENLLRVFRLDLVWQWSHYDFPGDRDRFAVMGSLRVDF